MAIREINYQGCVEQVEYSESYTSPVIVGEDDYIATGHTITENFDGTFSALRAKMLALNR